MKIRASCRGLPPLRRFGCADCKGRILSHLLSVGSRRYRAIGLPQRVSHWPNETRACLRSRWSGLFRRAATNPWATHATRLLSSQLIGLCLLTIAKRGAINSHLMSRPAQVALALLAIFSITYVLVTPDPTDDVTSVLRPSHFGKAQTLAGCVVLPLAPQIAIFRLSTPSCWNQRSTTLELVDLICTYRC